MQILTPQQAEWMKTIGWDLARSAVVATCAVVVHRLQKKIAAIPNSIVSAASALVAEKMKEALEEHKVDDARQFKETHELIAVESDSTRKEFHRALQEHVTTMHTGRHRAGD